MHLSEVAWYSDGSYHSSWFMTYIETWKAAESLVYFLSPRDVVRHSHARARARDCYTLQSYGNILIHERYRSIHFSKFQCRAPCRSDVLSSKNKRRRCAEQQRASMWRFALDQRSRETFPVNHRRGCEFDSKLTTDERKWTGDIDYIRQQCCFWHQTRLSTLAWQKSEL